MHFHSHMDFTIGSKKYCPFSHLKKQVVWKRTASQFLWILSRFLASHHAKMFKLGEKQNVLILEDFSKNPERFQNVKLFEDYYNAHACPLSI